MTDLISVLVVDDEPAFREGLRQALKQEGFIVHLAADGEEALEVYRAYHPDLVLLDVMLPRMSGIDVCREIRAVDDTPVIMVSARNEEIDAVVALEVGADDYVGKPYRVRELIARMRTVLRRAGTATTNRDEAPSSVLEVGDIALDRDRHEVSIGGAPVQLPMASLPELRQRATVVRSATAPAKQRALHGALRGPLGEDVRNLCELVRENEGTHRWQVVLKLVEQLQEEAADQGHGAGHVAEDEDLRGLAPRTSPTQVEQVTLVGHVATEC